MRCGEARFTVLTSQMIRMEWAPNALFEDHASFVFLNRNLPVPAFETNVDAEGDSGIEKLAVMQLKTLLKQDAGYFAPRKE